MKRGLLLLATLGAALPLGAASARERAPTAGGLVEVVVTMKAPALATAVSRHPALFGLRRDHPRHLDVRAAASRSYVDALTRRQQRLETTLARAIPRAAVRWRYTTVLDGIAVLVPSRDLARLASLPDVAAVYPSVRYHSLLDHSVPLIGAPALWGPSLETAGNGIKIGIVDDGVAAGHSFFRPGGFALPAGFPKGQTAYTSAKVIVARAFPPATPHVASASLPFDPATSEHGTHVAGIAAGDYATPAGARRLSGVAPRAYIGNYRVLTIPTPGLGDDGNSPEIAAGIEAAVRDGMDVINLSLGEPEVEPSRDLVVRAIDAAAQAGVVPVIAAGNDFDRFGFGSVGSPGDAQGAITVAAATKSRVIADFSSAGPTPVSLRLKPDVTAPGVGILSSVPSGFEAFDGTSMAAPHVAGAAALLRQRHPGWTVAQVKSALVLTGTAVRGPTRRETLVTREGGGLVDLPAANDPLAFAAPSSLSFGFLRRAVRATRTVELADAGGGAGAWAVALELQTGQRGAVVSAPTSVVVPGRLSIGVATAATAREGDVAGFVVLTRGTTRRRIPFWGRVAARRLEREPHFRLRRPGSYSADTRPGRSLVTAYRYPDDPTGSGVPRRLAGPERVFRLVLRKPVANFGVVLLSEGRHVDIEPRIVRAGDENRLTGYAALPLDLNPYRDTFGELTGVAGAVLPTAGSFDVVFDSTSRTRAGRFRFRFWIGDTTPPTISLLTRVPRRGSPVVLAVADRGSGVDPQSLFVELDGRARLARYAAGRLSVGLVGVGRGRHRLTVAAADYQETKNMEDVPLILPNTRRFTTTFVLR